MVVYLNGQYCPIEQAKISPLDRGFLLGDGVYDAIPTYRGQLFKPEEHLNRLMNSLAEVQINVPLSKTQWTEIFENLLERNNNRNSYVYIQVTRGQQFPRTHWFPESYTPTIFVFPSPMPEVIHDPVTATTLEDIRWSRCSIKAISLLANVLLYEAARDAGSDEPILLRHNQPAEGASCNLFVVNREGILLTVPKSPLILGGITREIIVELARKHEFAFDERTIQLEELQSAREIWLTSCTKGIRPVIQLNKKPVGDGNPGPVWKQMVKYFMEYKENDYLLKTKGHPLHE